MTFKEVLAQVIDWLQEHQCLSYRALKRQFDLDDAYLEDLKEELLYSYPVRDDEGRGLIWISDPAAREADAQRRADADSRFHAMLSAVLWWLHRERRVTYRTLKHLLGLDDALLAEIREELALRRLAIDEEDKVLVWAGETQPAFQPAAAITPMPAPPEAVTVTPATFPELAPSPGVTKSALPSSAEPSPPMAPASVPEPARKPPNAERRQLTVMFCDLADSTKLSQQLDPEDLREVIRAYQATAAKVTQQYEGHIAQYLGDGLLIYFGWPQAHEDDAQRALHTGLGIVQAVTTTLNSRLEQDTGVELAVRIGIHTGPVVVGEMGGGGRHEHLALGETTNIAARLEGLAQPNTVAISPTTARLVEGAFTLEDLGSHALKGVAEPIPVFQVLGPIEAHGAEEEARPGGTVFLVGRDEEVGLLLRRWEQSKDGHGQVVLISGEAGIGKSSLVATVRHYVVQEGYTRITFRCSPYHTNSALYPVIAHVQRVLHFQPGDTPATKLDKLERVLSGYSRPVEEVVPLYAALLSVPVPEEPYPVLNLSPQQQRQQTQDALVGWLLEEAERHPTLAMWEDLHWADPSTLEMLGLVLEQTPTVPMLHMLTFRPEFAVPWPTRSHMTPITLNRLACPQVEALIAHLVGRNMLPMEVVEHIVAKTDGVPLYVEELTKMLLESGLLREEAGHYVLTGPLTTMAIPDTLQGSLMARLDQLDIGKEVAQLGAVLGREFAYEVLQAISSQDQETLQAGLNQLVASELLYQRGRPPRARYIFKHALIQDAAYASLLRSTRQQVHHHIAQVLEARFSETVETQPELLAHHYTEGNCRGLAVTYWQRAGQYALQRSAHREAIGHFTMGLDLLASLPDTREHAKQELAMRTTLGQSLMVTQGYTSAELERTYLRARELCQQVDDTTQLSSVLAGLRRLYHVRAEYDTALEIGEELLHLAQTREDPTILLWGHLGVAPPLLFQGELTAGHQHLERCLEIYEPQAHRDLTFRYGTDPMVTCGQWMGYSLWLLGYVDQALGKSHETHRLAEAFDSLFNRAIAGSAMVRMHSLCRQYEATQQHAEALIALSADQGLPFFSSYAMVFRGWAVAMQGQPQAGIAEIKQGMAARRSIGARIGWAECLAFLAQAHEKAGQIEDGLQVFTEAQAHIDATREQIHQAEVSRLKGALLLVQSLAHQSEAEASFYDALETARQQQAKSLELRAATSLARLWQSQSKRQEAYDLLAPVYGWFTEGFDTADLQEAKALLDELA